MENNEILNEIARRKERYLIKTENFNARNVIVICDIHDIEEIKGFFKNNDFSYFMIVPYIDNNTIKYLFNNYGEEYNYFISKKIMNDTIFKELKEYSFYEDNIYIGPTSNGYFDLYEKRENIVKNIDKIKEVINMLYDEKSINVYLNILTRLSMPYQFHFYYEIEDFKEYFCNEFIFSGEEVFLDAGVYNGLNIFEFLTKVEWKYNKIIGIEGDYNNYKTSFSNTSKVERLQLLNSALYHTNGKIKFLSTDKSSKLTNSRVGADGDIEVDTIAGDTLKEKFTFIKMDIEGSEKEALDGLKNTIVNFSPKLAICIYHFQKDFWEVPLKIREINKEYKFIIRNHKKLDDLTETVVYAWK